MKNNRLHIEYNDSLRTNAISAGMIESMRCTKLVRAKQIVAKREDYIVRSATFKDPNGIETKIV